MKQITLFENGGNASIVNSERNIYQDLIIDKINDRKKIGNFLKPTIENAFQNNNEIYKSSDLLDSLNGIDIYFDDSDSVYICIDSLKKSNENIYRKINIADVKNLNNNRYINLDTFSKMAYGGSVDNDKVRKVMHEFKVGKLYSSSGDKVTDRKQAIAIALSEARRDKKERGGYSYLVKEFDLKSFYKYLQVELNIFLKKELGVELKNEDGVFTYKNEKYYIRPLIKKTIDTQVLKQAILTINNRGREVAEIIFNPNEEPRFIANSDYFGWYDEKFKDGGKVLTSIPFKYKVRGIYRVQGNDIDEDIEFVGAEKENDEFWSLYQPIYGDKNEKVNTIKFPNRKMRDLFMGKSVFLETNDGIKVKVQRISTL